MPAGPHGGDVNVVFHVPEGHAGALEGAIGDAEVLLADGSVDVGAVVLVADGGAVEHLVAGGALAPDVTVLLDRGASVRACANALEARDRSPGDLLGGVEAVPSAMGELARLQGEGYAYVRP